MNKFFCSILCLFFSSVINAQHFNDNFLNFRHITTDDGLSHFQVIDITQDQNGYIWFGTNYGLNKYDGLSIQTFTNKSSDSLSISSSRITSIKETSDGVLWIGTKDGGLNKFMDVTNTFVSFKETNIQPNKRLGSNNVATIYEDSAHNLWVGARHGGLNLFSKKTNSFQTFRYHNNLISVTAIEEVNFRFLLVGTQNKGLLLFDKESKSFVPFTISFDVNKNLVNNISSIKIVKNTIWIASNNGLYSAPLNEFSKDGQLVFKEFTFIKENVNIVNGLYFYNNALWCATEVGLFRIAIDNNNQIISHQLFESKTNDKNSLSNDYVNTVFVDKSGVLWAGTNLGVNSCNLYGPAISNRTSDFLSSTLINSILEDSNGHVWLGLQNGNLCKYNKSSDTIIEYINQPGKAGKLQTSGSIDDIAEDKFGNLWIASWGGGINILNLDKEGLGSPFFKQLKKENKNGPSENIITSIECFQGEIYVGTYRSGMDRFIFSDNGSIKEVVRYDKIIKSNKFTANTINHIYNDTIGNCLWVSTPEGLSKGVKAKEDFVFTDFKSENKKNRISHNFVWEVIRTSKEHLWIGTIEDGLNKITFDPKTNRQLSLDVYRKEDGLPTNSIQSISFDKENKRLWLGGEGVTLFDIDSASFKTYNLTDGINGSYFRVGSAEISKSGHFYFGSNGGLNIIKPLKNTINPFPPKVKITNISLFGKKIGVGQKINDKVILNGIIDDVDRIEFDHDSNNISFDFIALHYANPSKNKYKYKLDGIDENWISSSSRHYANYSNLAPGDYVFEVKAANSDGIWNENPERLKISILKPWWLEWWAFLIYLILFFGILYFLFFLFMQRQKMSQDLAMERIKFEKNEEVNMLKIRFFTNISHELRTPLTLISGPLESIIKTKEINENTKYYLNLIQLNTDRLLRLFNQLLDFRKLETKNLKLHLKQKDILPYIKIIASSFNYNAKSNNIAYAINTDLERLVVWYDRDVIEKILYNLLSNAFKFTSEYGKIDLDIKAFPSENVYKIIVSDSGTGIGEDEFELVFESFYQSEHHKKRGTGIGLALVKSLVEMHYGTIELSSEVNKGTSFIITLPMGEYFMKEEEKDVDDFEHIDLDKMQLEKINEVHKPSIVVVEDHKDMGVYLKKELSDEYEIHLCSDGVEAYKVIEKINPDVVLSDVLMPNMNGVELCEKLKGKASLSHIPFILISAKTSDEDRLEGIESGADAYIKKPFKLDYLHAKIKNLIEDRKKVKQFFAANKEGEDMYQDPNKNAFLKEAEEVVLSNLDNEKFDSQTFAEKMNITYSSLYNKLKTYANCTVSAYIRLIKLKEAAKLMANSEHNISEIIYKVGFNDAKYFRENFKKYFGVSPSVYIKNYRKIDK